HAWSSLRDLADRPRYFREDSSSGTYIGPASPLQRVSHCHLDGAWRSAGERHGPPFQAQTRSPAVARVGGSLQPAPGDEPFEDTRDRARMKADDVRELAGREPGEPSHHAQ